MLKGTDIHIPFGLIIFVMLFLNFLVLLASWAFNVRPPGLGKFDAWYAFLLLAGFMGGMGIGKLAEGYRWRRNANDPMRLFSRGRLYKVKIDDFGLPYKEVKKRIVNGGEWPDWTGLYKMEDSKPKEE